MGLKSERSRSQSLEWGLNDKGELYNMAYKEGRNFFLNIFQDCIQPLGHEMLS